jgi:hypothetical protein
MLLFFLLYPPPWPLDHSEGAPEFLSVSCFFLLTTALSYLLYLYYNALIRVSGIFV